MSSCTMERRQEATLRSQTQNKGKKRSRPVNLFSFDDYKKERREAAFVKKEERRLADESNLWIDNQINKWLDDSEAAGLAGIVIDSQPTFESFNGTTQAILELGLWCQHTGRARLVEIKDDYGDPTGLLHLFVFPKNFKKV